MFYLFIGILSISAIFDPLQLVSSSSISEDVTKEIFGDTPESFGNPIAILDLDGDRLMDMIFLRNNLTFFQVYFGFTTEPYIRPRSNFTCDLSHLGNQIVGLSGGDFTGDGLLDLVVTLKRQESMFVSTYIIKGNSKKLDCQNSMLFLNGTNNHLNLRQEPLIVDANGDFLADLLGETEDLTRTIWIFSENETPPKSLIELSKSCKRSQCLPMSDPHGSAFVDLDGDFSPEIVITSTDSGKSPPVHHFEIYSIDGVDHYSVPHIQRNLDKRIQFDTGGKSIYPQRIGSPIFIDINQSAKVCPIIPYCSDLLCNESGLVIYENERFIKLDVHFTISGTTWGFIVPDPSTTNPQINVRVGDYDLDGYTDLLATLVVKEAKPASSKPKTKSVIFFNVPCNHKSCSFNRTFSLNFDILANWQDPINAVFYDFFDDGLLDVLLVQRLENNNTKSSNVLNENEDTIYKVHAVKNSPGYDGYFLKWMFTSGRCNPMHCPPYGAVVPGASMNYTMLNQQGENQVFKAAQFFRSSFFPMDLPFTTVGTGSSPNFIDTIFIGKSASKQLVLVQKWRQIIPNSHLVVLPYSIRNVNKWELKHFLSANKQGAISTLQALLLILFINALIVFMFWFKERKEDRRNVQLRGNLNFIRLS